MNVTIGRKHGDTEWQILISPNQINSVHKKEWSKQRSKLKHRSYAEIVLFTTDGARRKRFNRKANQEIDSSSSASSSSSSSSLSSATSQSSVNSSSSSSSSLNSSSSSSSSNSSSSSS